MNSYDALALYQSMQRIDAFPISKRLKKVLAEATIDTLVVASRLPLEFYIKLPNSGRKTAAELQALVKRNGFYELGAGLDHFDPMNIENKALVRLVLMRSSTWQNFASHD